MRSRMSGGCVGSCALLAATAASAQQRVAAPVEVRIQNVHNRVEVSERAASGQRQAPRSARDNEALSPGTMVITHADAESTLRYGGDGELQVDERTEVVLFGAGATLPAGAPPVHDTSVVRGAVRVIVEGAPITLHTPGGNVQMTRGEFRVHVDPSHATRVAAYRGRARVTSADRGFLIGAGTATRVDASRPGAPAFPPVPVPRSPVWTQPFPPRLLAVGGTADVEARYAPPPAQRHPPHQWVQVLARDERFDDIVFERTVEAADARFHAERLPQGVYFARVISVDGERFESLSSATQRFEIVAPRIIPGGPGRRAEVLVPRGLFCRLDGETPLEAGEPYALLPARAHELSCSVTADMQNPTRVPIPADQAGELTHEVSLVGGDWSPAAGGASMVVRLRDASGRLYPYASIEVRAPRGVEMEPLREEAERGVYATYVRWPANTPLVLDFEVNRAARFTERFGPVALAPTAAATTPAPVRR